MKNNNKTTKLERLKQNGTFNHNSKKVNASLFKSNTFFDEHDLVQVKYEMLRSVVKDGNDVTKASKEFGFSRVSFYQIKEDYQISGITGLIPKKRGPRNSRKLSPEDIEYAKKIMNDNNRITKKEILEKLKTERDVTISKRTLERNLVKKNSE